MHKGVLTLPCRGQTLLTVKRQLATPWAECPWRQKHTWFLPSPVTSVCMYYKTWSYWSIIQSVYVCFPSLHVESRTAVGVCAAASWVGGLFECYLVRFWPILNLPGWSPQDVRALKGTLWWCLCYLCECCCRIKGRKWKKKNWVKQEKPESPQDGQLQQEEVPHVAVTLKCLRKSAHLCVFIRLFKRSRILQIQNFRLEPVSAARSASFILTGNWAFYLGFNLQGKFFVMSTVSLIIINTMMALHSPKMHVIMEFLLILLSLSKCYVYDGFWA